ncbi:MAG TPA: glycosyl hydrolase family 8 [Candidatus Omnitrophota bacterium]|nr:glycosyl hydrolase family 8 [Candidatus Omnitrophota bacterium]
MSSVNNISGFSRVVEWGKRIARPIVLTTAVAVPSVLGGYAAYKVYNEFTAPAGIEFKSPETSFSDALNRSYTYWKKNFTVRLSDNSLFVFDPSRDNRIVSEGMGFGLLMAVQNNDRDTFDALARGLSKMEGRGLPAWQAFIENGQLAIRSDSEWSSATDADQDIAFAFIQAHFLWDKGSDTYREIAQHYLNLIWDGSVQYDGNSAILKPSEDWGGATSSSGVIYNVSYPSLFMIEAFNRVDRNPAHNWGKLLNDTLTLREKIVSATELKTGRLVTVSGSEVEETVPKTKFSQIPDWVEVSWTAEKGISLFVSSSRSYKTGYDAVRTLWRIALDAQLLNDRDARNRSILLARQIMNSSAGKSIPDDIAITDENGKDLKGTELALAAYTSLAYAAALPTETLGMPDAARLSTYKKLEEKLKGIQAKNGSFAAGKDSQADRRYYVQTSVWICGRSLEGGFSPFYLTIYGEQPGKGIQVLEEKHRSGYLLHTEYLPVVGGHGTFVSPSDRAELDLMKKIIWLYQESQIIPDNSRKLEVRLDTARGLKGLLYTPEAINQYRLILESASYPSAQALIGTSINELDGALKDAGVPVAGAIYLYREMLKKNSDNPYLKLGLAKWLSETYNQVNYPEAMELIKGLTAEAMLPDLKASAFELKSDILVRQADYFNSVLKINARDARLEQAQQAIDAAVLLYVTPRLGAEIYYKKAQIEHKRALMTKKSLTLAIETFKHFISLSDASDDLRLKAVLELSACYRESKTLENLDLAQAMIEAEIGKHPQKTDPERLQLLNEKFRLMKAHKADNQAITSQIYDTLGSVPTGDLIVYFEQIKYFLDKGEYLKARNSAQELAAFADEVNSSENLSARIIADEQMAELKKVEKHIRSQLLPKISNNPSLQQEAKAGLISMISKLSGISPEVKTKYTDLANNGRYEQIAVEIEKSEEMNVLRKEFVTRQAAGEDLWPRNSILALARGIRDDLTGRNDISAVRQAEADTDKAIRLCSEILAEKSLSGKYFEALLDFMTELVWIIDDNGKNHKDALLLLEELLNFNYTLQAQTGNPLLPRVLPVLRNKAVRQGINSLIEGNPSKKAELLSMLAEMYNMTERPEDSLKAYRQSLGLSPAPASLEAEKGELTLLVKARPETLATVIKMRGIADSLDDNGQRAAMLESTVAALTERRE